MTKESFDLETKLVKDTNGALATTFNMFVITLFITFAAVVNVASYGIGVLVYIRLWGLSLVWAFNGALIAFTCQTLAQVMVGFYGDKIVTRYGRRKPFVVAGVSLKIISLLFLTLPPNHDQEILIVWFTVFLSMNFVGDAIYSNPYESWMIESTRDDDDYTKIYSIANPIGGIFGQIIGISLLFISPVACGVVYAIGASITTAILVTKIPNIVYREAVPLPDLIPSVRICSQTLEFRKMFLNKILLGAAVALFAAILGFFLLIGFESIEKVEDTVNFVIYVAGISAIIGLILMVSCNWIFKKIDKLKFYLYMIVVVILLAFVSFFVTLSGDNTALILYVCVATGMASLAFPVRLVDNLFVRDLVVYDTFICGLNRENMYITALIIPSNICIQFISALPICALSMTGFKTINDDDDTNDDDLIDMHYKWNNSSLWVCRVFGSICICIIAALSFYILHDYGLTASISDQINEVVKARAAKKAEAEAEGQDTVTPSDIVLSPKDNTTLKDADKQLLLHLSVSELFYVSHMAATASASSDVLRKVARFNTISALTGAGTLLTLLAALVVDMIILGIFSTAVIAMVLLLSFFIIYEYFRGMAITTLSTWDVARLHHASRKVYEEFSLEQATLKEMLQNANINVEEESNHERTSRNSIENYIRPSLVNKKEVEYSVDSFVEDFYRLFAALGVLFCCGLAVILYETMN